MLILGPGHIPDAAIAYLNWVAQQTQSDLERFIGWVALIATGTSIIAALGMGLFFNWARLVFVLSIAVLIASEPLMDFPVLKAPGEYFLDSIAGVLSGAIIVFSYWSRLADEFSRNAP